MLPRPMRPLRLAAPLLACSLALASPATATPIKEPATGLALDLAAPGTAVCVVLPRGAANGEACSDIDPEKMADTLEQKGSPPRGLAQAHVGEWSFLILMEKYDVPPVRTAEQIDEFVRHVAAGAAAGGAKTRVHGDEKGKRYDLAKVNGVDVIRSQIEMEAPEGSPLRPMSRVLMYTFVGKAGMASVAFTSDPEHAAAVRPLAEAMVATATMAPLDAADFGQPAEVPWTERLRGPSRILVFVAVFAVFVQLAMRWSKKKTAAGDVEKKK
jgi:hypothetical protein